MGDENRQNNRGEATRFKPGQTGNPKGRPSGVSITTILKKKLKEIAPQDKIKKRKYVELLAEATILNAMKGNGAALKIVFDRIDGVLSSQVELTGKDGKDLIPDARVELDTKLAGLAARVGTGDVPGLIDGGGTDGTTD